MRQENKIMVCGAAVFVILLCGCGKEEENPVVSANTISVAEEIANGVSTNVIPAEALEYYALDYKIPEGFSRAPDSTDTMDIYASDTPNDYSYIAYMRQENNGATDYANLSDADYKASLDKALSVNTVIQSVEKTRGDGHMHVKVLFTYLNEHGKMEVTEHIFITDKYIFEMVYAKGPEADWKKAFAESEAELRLVNVAQQ